MRIYVVVENNYINSFYGWSDRVYCIVDSEEKAESIVNEQNLQHDERFKYFEYEEYEVR
jgi:hypothetical protein